MQRKVLSTVGAAGAVTVLLGSCGLGGGGSSSSSAGSSALTTGDGHTVTLVTHDSWAPDAKLIEQFTKQTGYTVKVQKSGDAGALANKLVLSKDNPTGDAVFGIDNTFASRVTGEDVLDKYTSPKAASSASKYALPDGQGKDRLTPIDYGDVCVNVDDAWFAKHKLAKPASFDDLTKDQYKNLMAAPGASTSSPGMAFFLATVGQFGDPGWKKYWGKLMDNGLKLNSGWDDTWNVDYTAGPGKGTRPIVVSYDTSPPDTADKKTGKATTSAMLNTCFRSVEYAGVLKGAKNAKGAQALIDFLSGREFQTSLPESMYVMPVDSQAALPKMWQENAKISPKPFEISPDDIGSKRQIWLTQWKDITSK